MASRRESVTDAGIADIRWRLEQAMEKLDAALWNSALGLIIEAGEVCSAMIEAVHADRRREAHIAWEDYKDRYGEYPDMSEFC